MNPKLLALFTIVFSVVIFSMAFIFNVPVAFVPENATMLEYIMYHIVFIVVEVAILTFLLMHMIMKSKLEFNGKLSNLFN